MLIALGLLVAGSGLSDPLAHPHAPGLPTAAAQSEDREALHVLLDRWLDARFDAEEDPPKELLDLAPTELEALLRAGRFSYPELAVERGEVLTRDLVCDHVDYATEYFLYVSTKYDPSEDTSLLLIGHGGNSNMSRDYAAGAAMAGFNPWLEEVEKRGWIAAAPLTRRGWGGIGNSVLLTAVSSLSREFRIDPDRVYVTGHSMGGHLSWRSGIHLADRWGAIAPMSGGYDYVERREIELLFNVPGYAVWGKQEPYEIADHNRLIRDWMKKRSYPWRNVEKKGGHEIFEDEIPKVAKFLEKNPRDLYREAVYAAGRGRLRWETAPEREDWDQAHTWNEARPILRETAHWLRLEPLPPPEEGELPHQRVWAEWTRTNRLEITSTGARRLRIYLHPEMVKLDRPIRIEANDEVVFEGLVESDARTLLELVREFDDRGRIFYAAVDVEIQTDEDVPRPSYR